MELLNYLGTHLKLTPEQSEKINAVFKYEECSKGEILLKPDNRSQKVMFIEKGFIRTYYYNKDGKDITHNFFSENSFSVPLVSTFYNKPTPYGREVLENSIIRSVQCSEVEPFFSQIEGFEKLVRLLLIDFIKVFFDRLYAQQFQSAQDRYKALIESHPQILLNAPLGHIASYLGITQQTLSVIRAMK